MTISHETRHKVFQAGMMILAIPGTLGCLAWLLAWVGLIRVNPDLAFGITAGIVVLAMILIACGETESQSSAQRMRLPGNVSEED